MTPAQLTTLAAHIRANTDPAVIASLSAGDLGRVADWYNAPGTVKAWRTEVSKEELFGSLNLTSYDGLTAGKRDTFRLIFDSAPVNFCNDKIRTGITDIFSAADEAVMLAAGTAFASHFEEVFGGVSATSGTVTAIKRNVVGQVTFYEIADALRG